MSKKTGKVSRREFIVAGTGAGLATALTPRTGAGQSAEVLAPAGVKPVVISDLSGIKFKNGGPVSCVEKAFEGIVEGKDVLDAILAGVNIVELDPEESGVGYGGSPNAEGVVQLDASCMHGPLKRAGGVAALEGVRTPSLVARAVMQYTDHHLLVGKGAQDFARNMGFEIEGDLNTERSRKMWLEWKRRIDPGHYLDPEKRVEAGHRAAVSMVKEGLIDPNAFWGTIHCSGISSKGEICAVTSTSGLSFKIPGRTGDSPILGAGIYVDGEVGAAGSTGRGEANLYNLASFLIVEEMRRGMHPKDAGMEALRRIKANTIEKRLLNRRGLPNFNLRFFVLNSKGEYAGVSMYAAQETHYAACTENGAEALPLEGLLEGEPFD